MIQCSECEFFRRGADGAPRLLCDPFSTIKEPECLAKWQIVKLEVISRSHQATLDMYRRLAPLQERMMRQMEQELDEVEEADKWKYAADDEDEEDDADIDRPLRDDRTADDDDDDLGRPF